MKEQINYIITIDSGCDLPMSLCKKRNIIPLQLTYNMDNEIRKDSMDEKDYKMFYDKLRNGSISHTSQANLYEYLDFWYNLISFNLPIIHICLGSGMSGSYQNALLAKEVLLYKFPNTEIYVVDSKIASLGCGMLGIQAANMRDQGMKAIDTYNWLEENKLSINTYYTTHEFKYLYRSGRVSRIGAFFGKIFGINSILKVDRNGKMVMFNKTPSNVMTRKIVEESIRSSVVNPSNQTLYICHSDNLDEAQKYGDRMKKEFGFKEVYYTFIGPTVGSHTGPGLVAIFYYGRPRTKNG